MSVILCTHNPRADHLERALAGLREQTMPMDRWELVMVDNASRQALAGSVDLGWHPAGRHVREEELGLTQARLRGIVTSTGRLLVFVDDDNVLQPDYLERAEAIAAQEPEMGCFGSARILPEFEEEPASELLPYTRVLALRDEPGDQASADPEDWAYPWGAGLVVRRSVADAYVDVVKASRLKLELDRRGDQLNSCGDDEFSWVAIGMGFKRGVYRSLVVRHLIAARRVRKEYLLALYESFGYSRALLLHTHGRPVPTPAMKDRTARRSPMAKVLDRIGMSVGRDQPPTLAEEFKQAQRAGLARFHRTHGPSAG